MPHEQLHNSCIAVANLIALLGDIYMFKVMELQVKVANTFLTLTVDVHHQIVEVYGPNLMIYIEVQKW